MSDDYIEGFHLQLEGCGFAPEGVRRRARKIDGAYDDNIMMALVFDA